MRPVWRDRGAPLPDFYRIGERIADERTGLVHDYTRRSGVVYSGILTPSGAPEWVLNRERLWSAPESADAAERRKDSRVAGEIEVAFPAELSVKQRLDPVKQFALDLVDLHGLAADIAIHKPGRAGDVTPTYFLPRPHFIRFPKSRSSRGLKKAPQVGKVVENDD